MAFTVSGTISGIKGTRALTLDGSTLSGDAVALRLVVESARRNEGKPVGPDEGPYTLTKHLRSQWSAFMLMLGVFERGSTAVSGNPPQREPIPFDAVG